MLQIAMFTFSPIQENTYLLYNGTGDAAIIDPGCYFDEEKETLAKFIAQKNLHVQYLLQTHCHLDHIFGLKWAAETYTKEPYMHANEQQVLAFGEISGQKWNLPFASYAGPIQLLTEGQQIHIGSDVLKVLFAPGHSPGHVCFLLRITGFCNRGRCVVSAQHWAYRFAGRQSPTATHQHSGATIYTTKRYGGIPGAWACHQHWRRNGGESFFAIKGWFFASARW